MHISNNKKNVLLIGSSSFIGKSIKNLLIKKKYNIFETTRKKNLKGKFYLDLLLPEKIEKIRFKKRIDIVILCAAKIGWYDNDINELFIANVLSTGHIANLAKKNNAKLIYLSAAIVHGVQNSQIEIKSKIKLDTLYAKSKFLGEEMINFSGVKHCIIRLGGVYGLNGPSHLGINKSISLAINKIQPTIIGKGNGLRNYVYVKDVARLVEKIISNNIEGTYLFGGEESISIKSMIIKISEVFLNTKKTNLKKGGKDFSQIVVNNKRIVKNRTFDKCLKDILKDSRL